MYALVPHAPQTALRTVIYQNTAETTQPNRIITFRITDGSAFDTAALTVTVEEVNDLPEIALDTTGVAFDGSLMTLQPMLNITDRDSTTLSAASVTISTNCDENVDSLLLSVPAVRPWPTLSVPLRLAGVCLLVTGSISESAWA